MTDIIIASPLRGWAAPLEEVPDPVFAERMLGDGVAIHPLDGTLASPCDGEVVAMHAAGHAVTIRTAEGAEILIHFGIDTVALEGSGFTARATVGQKVRRGDQLIDCDLDQIARSASSLVTPVILANPEAFDITSRNVDRQVTTGDVLMVLTPAASVANAQAATDGPVQTRSLTVALPHGMHARPAAQLIDRLRGLNAELWVVHESRKANARSATGLLGLNIRCGDTLIAEARGLGAEAAFDAMASFFESGVDESPGTAPAAEASRPPQQLTDNGLAGITAAPGLALGPAARLEGAPVPLPPSSGSTEMEKEALKAALERVRSRVEGLAATGPAQVASVMRAHLALLADPELIDTAETAIGGGDSAGEAWQQAIARQADMLRATGDARLIERIDDLRDLERQVLLALSGETDSASDLPEGSILVARDLLPSQLSSIQPQRLAGVCLERGGPTSHVAILCAGLGIPALVALGDGLAGVADGTLLGLDADAGVLHVAPNTETAEAMSARITDRSARRAEALARAGEGCQTADGTRIELFANLGSAEDARVAVANGAEGCGLLRTEFLFLGREQAPDEDEQAAAYQAVVDAMDGRPVIARLLDVGGDKAVPYLGIPAEENPALGLRGIRVGLARPQLLETQLRALLRVEPRDSLRIMVPMVASLSELRSVRSVLEQVGASLGLSNLPQLGIMVETPAAAMIADQLAKEADFLSIGSNDLSQYTLAIDRGNALVASGFDPLHPAVLRLIAETCTRAAAEGRWTGLCGGLASDAAAIPILVGLGVTELSAVPAFVPEAKAIVRRLNVKECQAHAARALDLGSAAEVRALARGFEEECSR